MSTLRIALIAGLWLTSVALSGACSGGAAGGSDGGDGSDGGAASGTDAGMGSADAARAQDARDEDAGAPPARCDAPINLKRGNAWVRSNPMFISALTPSLAAPRKDVVDDYFDLFGANAAHLWADGLPSRMDSWAAAGRSDFRWLSWTMSNGRSADGNVAIDGYAAATTGRIGYQVGDEPETWASYNKTVAGIEVVRAADPDALVFMNFSHPDAIIDDLLDDYGQNNRGDIVSFDTYNDGKGAYRFMVTFRKKALEYGLPYWCYLRLYRSGTDSFWTEADMRWSAFAHALFGYTGYSWFIYQISAEHPDLIPAGFSQIGNFDPQKTERYFWAAGINAELVHLGRSLAVLTSTDVRWIADYDQLLPSTMTMWSPGAGNNPYITDISTPNSLEELSVGFFDDDCGDKTTGAIRTMALASRGGADQKRLTITLPAGEVFFFKYKSAHAFATQQL